MTARANKVDLFLSIGEIKHLISIYPFDTLSQLEIILIIILKLILC